MTLSFEELQRVADRQRWAMQVMSERVGSLFLENTELMSIIHELQDDLAETRKLLSELQQSGDVMTADLQHAPH